MTEEEWIEWATTGRPHGVHGEIRLFLHNPDSELLDEVSSVRLVGPDGRVLVTTLTSLRPGPKSAIARFAGVAGREAADSWKNAAVEVPASLFPELSDEEWYAFELEGLSVFRPDGSPWGVVESLTEYGAGDILVIRRGGDVEFLPFAEPYVVEVDLDARTITVDPSDFEFE